MPQYSSIRLLQRFSKEHPRMYSSTIGLPESQIITSVSLLELKIIIFQKCPAFIYCFKLILRQCTSNYLIVIVHFLRHYIGVCIVIVAVEIDRRILIEPNDPSELSQHFQHWSNGDQVLFENKVVGSIRPQHLM